MPGVLLYDSVHLQQTCSLALRTERYYRTCLLCFLMLRVSSIVYTWAPRNEANLPVKVGYIFCRLRPRRAIHTAAAEFLQQQVVLLLDSPWYGVSWCDLVGLWICASSCGRWSCHRPILDRKAYYTRLHSYQK